eukprot:5969229-Amphidinium_carterae.1
MVLCTTHSRPTWKYYSHGSGQDATPIDVVVTRKGNWNSWGGRGKDYGHSHRAKQCATPSKGGGKGKGKQVKKLESDGAGVTDTPQDTAAVQHLIVDTET